MLHVGQEKLFPPALNGERQAVAALQLYRSQGTDVIRSGGECDG